MSIHKKHSDVVSIFTFLFLFNLLTVNIHSQIRVQLPKLNGAPNSTIIGKINVSDLTQAKVSAFQFAVYYDNSIIKITGVDVAGSLIEGNIPTINADTLHGKIVVAWASANPIIGKGTLLNLKIKLLKTGLSKLTTVGEKGETFIFNAGNPAAFPLPGEIIVKDNIKKTK
jgi:hypothetical protein